MVCAASIERVSGFIMSPKAHRNRREQGTEAETLAATFLEGRGMRVIERNYRFERGEIDIVAEDGNELVFVEVKARRSNSFGEPEDAVTPEKEEQIKKVAEGYLFERQIEDRACRFDVVAVSVVNGKKTIRHLTNAF